MTDETRRPDQADDFLMPSQVARLFRVDPKTLTRWSGAGKLHPSRRLAVTAASERPHPAVEAPILARHATRLTNRPANAGTLLVKKIKSAGHGFRNLDNYR